MKAVVFDKPGEAARCVRIADIGMPSPKAGEVLVSMQGRPIHPADFMFIEGRYRIKPALPQVAGLEGTGTVVGAGDGAQTPVGARVAFRHPGAWAEFAAVPEDRLYRVPDDIPADSAAQFSLNPVTAWALLDELDARQGDWIAINAASSNIARLVSALCQRRGVRVLGIVRSGSTPPEFPSIAHDTSSPPVATVLEATRGTPLAGFLDNLGGSAITALLGALRPGATIVSFAVLGKEPASVGNADLIYRNLTWKGFGIDHWLTRSKDKRAAMAHELWTAIRSGDVVLPVRKRYVLADVRAALVDAEQSGATGKVLLVS